MERYRIAVAEEVLEDLRERLARTRFPDQIEGADWGYGTELSYLKELCEYWREQFDWRTQEAALNRYDQFRTTIDGQTLHFIHARSQQPDAIPIVITHGWPGSVFEFVKIIGPLIDPVAHGGDARDAFHVICPSMPGYGFSGPTCEAGWDVQRVAEAEIELMKRLDYDRYGAQGGDWGAIVSTQIGRLDPDHCCAIFPKELYKPPRKWVDRHYNVTHWTEMEIGGHFAALEQPDLLVDDVRAFFRGLR